MKKNGLGKEDACDRMKWREIVKTMTIRNPTPPTGKIPDPTCDMIIVSIINLVKNCS